MDTSHYYSSREALKNACLIEGGNPRDGYWTEADPVTFKDMFNNVAADTAEGRKKLTAILEPLGIYDRVTFVGEFIRAACETKNLNALELFDARFFYGPETKQSPLNLFERIAGGCMSSLGRDDGFCAAFKEWLSTMKETEGLTRDRLVTHIIAESARHINIIESVYDSTKREDWMIDPEKFRADLFDIIKTLSPEGMETGMKKLLADEPDPSTPHYDNEKRYWDHHVESLAALKAEYEIFLGGQKSAPSPIATPKP